MSTRNLLPWIAAVAITGCGLSEPREATRCDAVTTTNAIGFNAIAWNGIVLNGIVLNGLSDSELDLSCSPQSLQVFEYLVGCALAPDQQVAVSVDGEEHTVSGALGLAPEWIDGPCDGDCQGWVSACMIARTNARGERVEISLRGAHPGLDASAEEREAFPVHEGAYFGDIFADEPVGMACLGDGVDHLDRTCGELDDCPIEVLGACSEICDEAGCRGAGGALHHAVSVYRDAL